MTVSAAPSIFGAYNARMLTYEDVAQTFIPPHDHLAPLLDHTNTLLVGPRGTGKTTLLKMLHPAALEAWQHEDADAYRSRVNFTGIFIPTDLNWSKQVSELQGVSLDAQSHRLLEMATITTHVLRSLIDSMAYRAGRLPRERSVTSHRRVLLNAEDERELATALIEGWALPHAVPSLEGLSFALSRRFGDIKRLASQEAFRGNEDRSSRLASIDFLHLDFLAEAGFAVERYNQCVGEPGARWALLFDELEIAPAWLCEQLFQSLRATNQHFLFKLSLSPYTEPLGGARIDKRQPQEKQDYTTIPLWYVNKDQGRQFSEALFRQLCVRYELGECDPLKILGMSAFYTPRDEFDQSTTAYRRGTTVFRRFKSLAERDDTFRDYLRKQHIDLDQIQTIDPRKRASSLRKAAHIVALREYFKGEGQDLFRDRIQKRRSRNVATIYGGADALFAMVEGNPRWLKGIVGPLLSHLATTRRTKIRLNKPQQVRAVVDAANVFRAMLRTIPSTPVGNSHRGILAVIDALGDYFAEEAIDAPFSPEPPCTFTVDSMIEPQLEEALGKALNAGAIVYAPEGENRALLTNLRGKRFRLSYLLAPHYYTPLILGKHRALNSILQAPRKAQSPEPTLFAPREEESDE